jgi:hypothetical protein
VGSLSYGLSGLKKKCKLISALRCVINAPGYLAINLQVILSSSNVWECSRLPEVLQRAVAVDREVKTAAGEVNAGLKLLQTRVKILVAQRERLKRSDGTLQKKITNLERLVHSCRNPGTVPETESPGRVDG